MLYPKQDLFVVPQGPLNAEEWTVSFGATGLARLLQNRTRQNFRPERLRDRTLLNSFDFFGLTGAGEGIRTLDPNLGKVVLYH